MSDIQDGTAVSRSGRLRKRSTKLADFDSSDEPSGRVSHSPKKNERTSKNSGNGKVDDELDGDISDFDDLEIKDEEEWELPDDDSSFLDVKLTDEDFRDDQSLDNLNLPPEDLDFADEDFDVDDEDTNDAESSTKEDTSAGVAQSLYFSEKHGKKGAGKDGIGGKKRKAHRKDKGKSRFTAYMLWAQEVRPDIIKTNPEMDFASVNKKLGELWQLVPTTQKYVWKRRAKRVAVRLRQGGGMISTGRGSKAAAAAAAPASSSGGQSSPNSKAPVTGSASTGRQTSKRIAARSKRETVVKNITSPPSTSTGRGSRGGRNVTESHNDTSTGTVLATSPPSFKVTGTSAIDVAAHMKLLGESLNNIGHKLKEHEGQIAVSGSLSVLLDSMLCVLGPLMCLTDQLEETRGAIPPETHAAILDNIAYIMPGIV